MSDPFAASACRGLMNTGWELAEENPDAPGNELTWHAIGCSQPVAAALRALDRWNLDGPAIEFDALRWHYRCRLKLPPAPSPGGCWVLHFGGLATVARVFINGQLRLTSQSMFVGHEVLLTDADAAQAQQADGVWLQLTFEPLDAQLAQRKPRPRWRTPMVSHPQLRWWRTTLLGRTPGWSPPAAAVGPWRPIGWEYRLPDSLRSHRMQAQLIGPPDSATGRLQVDLVLGVPPGGMGDPGHVELCGADGRVHLAGLKPGPEPGHHSAVVDELQVRPWWPHTHGEANLYDVAWVNAAGISQPLGKVGFRRIEIDQTGGGFALRVNGEAVFCRGACWMPPDLVSLNAPRAAHDQAVCDAVAMGMNMLRVAGALVYEEEAFFDACDREGVLVWQDLMFANMDYPADDARFLAQAEVEVRQQAGRIAHRACLALICGNSEVEQQAAMSGAARELWTQPLFHQSIPAWLADAAPQVVYWPSSAHGGAFPHEPRAGTTSYYGVGAYRRELHDALSSRVAFATEALAVANIPSDATLQRLGNRAGGGVPPVHTPLWKSRVYRDLGAGWDFDDVREHYLRHVFGLDPEALRAHDPERHRVLGRLVSAELMARIFTLWRSAESTCHGALIWYLRDLWAGAGCGVLDDRGQRKSAAHALARVLQPLFAGWVDEGLNGLVLTVRNETPRRASGTATLVLYRDGRTCMQRVERAFELPARGLARIALCDWLDGWVDSSWAYRFGPPGWDLVCWHWQDEGGNVLAQALHVSPPDLLVDRGAVAWNARVRRQQDGSVEAVLSSDAAVYGVHFEVQGWQPSDEYFHLLPGYSRRVVFTPLGPDSVWYARALAVNTRQCVTLSVNT